MIHLMSFYFLLCLMFLKTLGYERISELNLASAQTLVKSIRDNIKVPLFKDACKEYDPDDQDYTFYVTRRSRYLYLNEEPLTKYEVEIFYNIIGSRPWDFWKNKDREVYYAMLAEKSFQDIHVFSHNHTEDGRIDIYLNDVLLSEEDARIYEAIKPQTEVKTGQQKEELYEDFIQARKNKQHQKLKQNGVPKELIDLIDSDTDDDESSSSSEGIGISEHHFEKLGQNSWSLDGKELSEEQSILVELLLSSGQKEYQEDHDQLYKLYKLALQQGLDKDIVKMLQQDDESLQKNINESDDEIEYEKFHFRQDQYLNIFMDGQKLSRKDTAIFREVYARQTDDYWNHHYEELYTEFLKERELRKTQSQKNKPSAPSKQPPQTEYRFTVDDDNLYYLDDQPLNPEDTQLLLQVYAKKSDEEWNKNPKDLYDQFIRARSEREQQTKSSQMDKSQNSQPLQKSQSSSSSFIQESLSKISSVSSTQTSAINQTIQTQVYQYNTTSIRQRHQDQLLTQEQWDIMKEKLKKQHLEKSQGQDQKNVAEVLKEVTKIEIPRNKSQSISFTIGQKGQK